MAWIRMPRGIYHQSAWNSPVANFLYVLLASVFALAVCLYSMRLCWVKRYESYRVHYYHGKYWRRERFREMNLGEPYRAVGPCLRAMLYLHTQKNSSARTKRRRESRSSFCRWRCRGTDSQNQIHLKQRTRVVMGRGRSTSRNHSNVWRVWRNSSFLQHKATQARRIRQILCL